MPLNDFIRPIASSRTLTYVFWLALLVGAYSVLPIAIEYSPYRAINEMPSEFHGALSLVLGWMLVFRTNTAYSRWWEARTLWGALVNACRNLSIKVSRLGDLTDEELSRAQRLIIAFPVALRHHLRNEIDTHLPTSTREMVSDSKHIPAAISANLYAILGEAKRASRIDGEEMRAMDQELLRFLDVCGGCERILNTRIVKSYRVFARQCVIIFLATLPWGIAHDFRIWTLPLTIISAYFMLGLETVAEHVEEPFGYDEDDLDLEALCETIENSVKDIFHSREISQRT